LENEIATIAAIEQRAGAALEAMITDESLTGVGRGATGVWDSETLGCEGLRRTELSAV
jgi:hypothetical protein